MRRCLPVVLAITLAGAPSCSSNKSPTPGATDVRAAPGAPGAHSDADYRAVDALFQRLWRTGTAPGWRKELAALLASPDVSSAALAHAAKNLQHLREPAAAVSLFERLVGVLEARADGAVLSAGDRGRLAMAQLAVGQTESGLSTRKQLGASDAGRAVLCGHDSPLRFAHPTKADRVAIAQWVKDWLASDARCDEVALALADLHQRRGDHQAAVDVLVPYIATVQHPSTHVLDQLASAHRANGQAEAAVALYRRICSTDACDARTRGNLVWAQADYHRQPQVMADAIRRADEAPTDHLRQFEVGVMLHYARKYADSQRFLTRARERWPTDPRILLYSAMNAYRSGRFAESRVAIAEAQANAVGEDADLYYCYAVIFRNHDLPVAIKNLKIYKEMAERVGSSTRKAKMVNDFLKAMQDEQARRQSGAPPRPFADPEADYFGEPPGSPGHAADAIRVTR